MNQDQMACPITKGEKILIALDGSRYSEAALEQAISLGRICNSTIYPLTVIDLYPEQIEVAPALVEKMSQDARAILDKAQERIKAENIACETIVHTGGQPHEFIIREAKERNVDLIVMGTHGRTGMKKLLMGSVAQKVIGHAPCPILVVPAL